MLTEKQEGLLRFIKESDIGRRYYEVCDYIRDAHGPVYSSDEIYSEFLTPLIDAELIVYQGLHADFVHGLFIAAAGR